MTIADMVADRRCLTPTDAATRAVPDRAEVLKWLEGAGTASWQATNPACSRLDTPRTKLDELASRRCFRQPLDRLRDEERRLDDWSGAHGAGRTGND